MGKKKLPKIPTIEEQIATIQKKLAENPPARDFAALTRTLGQLTGALKTYQRKAEPEPQAEPESLPSWWSEDWARVFISEKARGLHPALNAMMHRELDRFESEWAKQEGLSVPELHEALRREDAEYKAQHSEEDVLVMALTRSAI